MPRLNALPERPVDRLIRPMVRFTRIEAASGALLVGAAIVALGLANSDLAHVYHSILEFPIRLEVGAFQLDWTLHHWINDGLMTLFFFVVGLEIKREFVLGELRDPRKAALPVAAALGGMVVPAGIYLALQLGEPGEHGWGIPMATDIAFVVGCMALLGPRMPHGLRIMLLALAIVDDLGAILVIAFGYSSGVDFVWLALGGGFLVLCSALNRIGVRSIAVYTLVGVGAWACFVQSGVHPTVSGVLLGMLTPTRAWIADRGLLSLMDELSAYLHGQTWSQESERRTAAMHLSATARETVSPLERLETSLHPWSAFGIMTLFALANAGVSVNLSELGHPVQTAVFAGLVLGKPIGIFVVSLIAVRMGIARLPTGVDWPAIAGGGCLGGIGFTMALFVAGLALEGPLLDTAKIGILAGSVASAVLGSAILLMVLPRRAPETDLDAADGPGAEEVLESI